MNYTVVYAQTYEPYDGPDVNQKFPGEDDLIWCDRCKQNHRRGASPEVEYERIIQRAAKEISDRIGSEILGNIAPRK